MNESHLFRLMQLGIMSQLVAEGGVVSNGQGNWKIIGLALTKNKLLGQGQSLDTHLRTIVYLPQEKPESSNYYLRQQAEVPKLNLQPTDGNAEYYDLISFLRAEK
jgi:hypothetical protein